MADPKTHYRYKKECILKSKTDGRFRLEIRH